MPVGGRFRTATLRAYGRAPGRRPAPRERQAPGRSRRLPGRAISGCDTRREVPAPVRKGRAHPLLDVGGGFARSDEASGDQAADEPRGGA